MPPIILHFYQILLRPALQNPFIFSSHFYFYARFLRITSLCQMLRTEQSGIKGVKILFDPNIMSIIIVKCEQKIKLFFVIKVIEYHIAVKRD